MREIRVRGKRIKDDEWVVGEMSLTGTPCIARICEHAWDELNAGLHSPLADYTVTESTGLRDRNGVEIFEGDIVRFAHLTVHGTEERTGKVGRDRYNNWCVVGHDGTEYHINNAYDGAVVGNVFDNPELMTEKDNGNGDGSNGKS